jgi:hypothetical protein
MDFDIIDQLIVKSSCIHHNLEKKWEYAREYQLFIDYKKVNDSVGREILYNIFIEFRVSMKLFEANYPPLYAYVYQVVSSLEDF